jgi:hypothetical protein
MRQNVEKTCGGLAQKRERAQSEETDVDGGIILTFGQKPLQGMARIHLIKGRNRCGAFVNFLTVPRREDNFSTTRKTNIALMLSKPKK